MYFLGKKRSRKVTTFFYLITQLSNVAGSDNVAYVVKGRVVYDEDGNIDYDKSDDTIYYKVYDKDGNEVDGGTPKPIYLKTRRTEFGKVLSDVPIEEYVNKELYPQEQNNIRQAINNGQTNIEQSTPAESVTPNEYQDITEKNDSTEFDENGLPFVKTSNGVTDFGYIPEDTGLTPAPIRLSIGDERTGAQHIADRHGEQIAKAGFDNVVDFVEYVASNYDTITEGVDTSGEPNGTYLLQAKDKHNNTLYVELSNDGSYWNVNSGGVFRKGYGEKNKVVWSASEVQRRLKSATPDTLRSQDEADNQGDSNRTVSDTTSNGKGTTNNLNEQEEFYNSLPRNKKGEVDESQMSAEQKIMYAQIEFGQRADLVRDYVAEQSKALSEKIAKLTNKTGKSVAEYKELAAMQEDKNVFVEYLSEQRQQQEQATPRRTVEEAAEADIAEVGESRDVRYMTTDEINDRFNEELQQQIDGTLPKGHVYSLGIPNDILRSAGLPNLPIEMSAEMLKNKSSAKYRQHHPFDISSIKDLPRAIQNPIAVFNNPNNDGKVLLTELQYNGVNHIVAIKVRSERKSNNIEIDVNSVSTIFPKDRIEKIVEWLLDKENQGRKAYLNKEKVLTWLSDNETITRSKGYNTKDIAKVIKDFDNPTLSEEKNEETRLKASKRKARGATTEKLEELVTLLKKTGFADVKTGEDFYNALAEIEDKEGSRFMIGKQATESDERAIADETADIKAKAISDGTFMKAPNGKDTNLTERQWLQVRTKAFKRWFGDWENAYKLELIENLQPIGVDNKGLSRERAEEEYKKIGTSKTNRYDNRRIEFVNNAFGKIARHKNSALILDIIPQLNDLFESAIPIYFEEEREPLKSTNIVGSRNYLGKVRVNDEDYYVRITAQELTPSWKQNEKQGKSNFHNMAVSDIAIYDESGSSVTAKDYSIDNDNRNRFVDAKLQHFFETAREARENSSKVVDENGEPMVVYHGTDTRASFNKFKGAVHFFTENKDIAGDFGVDASMDKVRKGRDFSEYADEKGYLGYKIYETFLSLQNPFIVDADNSEWDEIKTPKEMGGKGAKTTDQIGRWAKRNGYGGVVIKNTIDANSHIPISQYIAFNPTQIKSATDNIGTFDGENEDIRYMRPNGTVLGFVKGNTIYLNPDEVSLNTPIHEFGHLWVSQVKEHFPDLWAKGKELFLESDYLRKVQADENYRHLDLDGQIDEAMARAIGDRGEQELDKTLLEKILDWIAEVWDKIGGVFGIDNLTSEQISNLTLQDFTDMATSELLSGQNLTERVNGNRGGATRYNTADETADIKAKAISDGTFMKAPNGKDTNLTERQWLQVRTKAFKKWFGDWEKTARIEKLKKTKPIKITGEEVKPSDDLKEYKKNALEYGKTLQGEYTNKDTGITIQLQRGRKNGGLNEVLQHDYKDREHLQSIAAIPQIIENATYIDSEPNNDILKNPDVKEYQYYVCGLKIGGEDYTVRAVVAVDNKGDRYYDHKLTNIEKGKLLDQINSQAIKNNGFGTTPGTKPTTVVSEYKDSKLISLLQENSSKVVDENGEPMVVYHGTDNEFYTFEEREGYNSELLGGERKVKRAGFFFSPNKNFANNYGRHNLPVFLNIKNLFNFKEHYYYTNSINETLSELFDEFVEYADEQGINLYNDYPMGYDYYIISPDDIWRFFDDELGSVFKRFVQSKGFDGVWFPEWNSDVLVNNFMLFSPTQIKSATDNIGTFNGEDEDIRYMLVNVQDEKAIDEERRRPKFEIKGEDVYTTMYTTRADTETEIDVLYNGNDFEKALSEAEGYNENSDREDLKVSVEAMRLKIPIAAIKEEYDYDDEEYDGDVAPFVEDYIDDFVENVDYDRYETGRDMFDVYKSKPDTDEHELIGTITDKLQQQTGLYIGKYSTFYITKNGEMTDEEADKDGVPNAFVSMRIADHTHNRHNGDSTLNIVIADDDPTKTKFQSSKEDLRYTTKDNAEEIVKDILDFWRQYAREYFGDINKQFNDDLDEFERNRLLSSRKFNLGRPSPILMSAGLNGVSIQMTQSVLRKHLDKHNLKTDDLRELPEAIRTPIMVYEWGDKARNSVIVTSIPRGEERITTTIRLTRDGNKLNVNEISSIYGKSAERLIRDINTPKSEFGKDNLRYVDKKQVLDWFAMEAPKASSQTQQELITATKVIENFENPPINEKKVIDDTTNDMVRYSIKASEQLDKEDEVMGETKSPQTKGFWFCDPEGIRTPDPQLRRLLLYPAELPDLYTILS